MPWVALAATNYAQMMDYLRSQTASSSRLLAQIRELCPNQQFEDYGTILERTALKAHSIDATMELTGSAMKTALNLLGEGKFEESREFICQVTQLRAEAVGTLNPGTLAAFNNMAMILRVGGRVAEARAMSEELLPLVKQYPPRAAQSTRSVMSNLATALFMQGYLSQAELLYRECIENAERLGEADAGRVGPTMTNLGKILDQQGRFAEAEQWYRRVLKARIAELGADHIDAAASYSNLGGNLTSQGKYADGERALRQGLKIRVEQLGERHLNTAFGVEGLAQNLLLQNRAREALSLAERGLSIRQDLLGESHPETAGSNYQVSRIELALGHPDIALRFARIALDTRLPTSRREESALSAEGRTYVRQNAGSAAFQVVRAVWEVSKQPTILMAKAEALREEAFLALQRIPLSDTGDALSVAAVRKLAGQSGLAGLVKDLETREERLRRLDTTLAANTTQGRPSVYISLKAEQTRLAGEIRTLSEKLKSGFPSYFQQVRAEPLSLAELRGASGKPPLLSDDEALVVMTPGSGAERGYLWAISREQVAWVELKVGPEVLKKAITQVLAQMALPGRGVKLESDTTRPAFDRKTAFALYGDLFGDPRIQAVVTSKARWIIVAQGALLATPFNALVTTSPKNAGTGDADPEVLRATQWLGLERALSFVPSVANLSTSRRTQPSRGLTAARPLFAMGDPVFVQPAGAGSAPSDVHQLSPLPGTRAEIDALMRSLRARREDVLLDVEATETALKQRSASGALEQARIVVFATHGLPAGSLSGALQEPALVLTQPARPSATDDGLLTASEAAQLRFEADWIVLSACDTAGSATTEGEGLTGLARAFLFAGGRALLVSQWRVGDDSAPLLVNGTVAAMSGNTAVSRSEALRISMRSLMNDRAQDRARLTRAHPAIWAPMILVGVD